jgi:pyruvate-formate lyase-activating enzyme
MNACKDIALPQINLPEYYNYIAVFFSMACPRNCSYCINDRDLKSKTGRISPGKFWVDSINRLKTDIPITIHGGEPLTYPDLYFVLNNLRQDIKVDLLSTFPFGVEEFIKKANPERFERDLPYPSIRVTYHFESMDINETAENVINLVDNGFDAGINLVDVPGKKDLVDKAKEFLASKSLKCTVKPFLGHLDGKLYGQYKYDGACEKKTRTGVLCRNSNLLVGWDGSVYRCHADLFNNNKEGILGNFFDSNFRVNEDYLPCNNFGFCASCDVQEKLDRFGRYGYCAAQIKGEGIVVRKFEHSDWR